MIEGPIKGWIGHPTGNWVAFQQPVGFLYSQNYIRCYQCRQRISNFGGPRKDILCPECFDTLHSKEK